MLDKIKAKLKALSEKAVVCGLSPYMPDCLLTVFDDQKKVAVVHYDIIHQCDSPATVTTWDSNSKRHHDDDNWLQLRLRQSRHPSVNLEQQMDHWAASQLGDPVHPSCQPPVFFNQS